jgi:hypothetical protein
MLIMKIRISVPIVSSYPRTRGRGKEFPTAGETLGVLLETLKEAVEHSIRVPYSKIAHH